MRHTLSGTEKDDALLPALYSRTGGNVTNKDRTVADENGNVREKLTCFRRGTTVWYLSRVVGAPCPFARAGIALRDYAEGSAIASIEGRKGEDPTRGIKRKRERMSSRRAQAETPEEEEEPIEGKKPPKIKLTLRLRPCLTTMREKPDEIASSSDSEAETSARPIRTDASPTPVTESASSTSSSPADEPREPAWSFPPFPIQRHISIPPYTPAQESFPSASSNAEPSSMFSDWPGLKPKLELTCVDAPPSALPYQRDRAGSIAFSVASPPPDSDDDFSMDDDDDLSFSMSPEVRFKEESDLAYEWPQPSTSTSSGDLFRVKVEPEEDVIPSKRSSLQTLTNVKTEDVDLTLGALSLSDFGVPSVLDSDVSVKVEDDVLVLNNDDSTWSSPIDLTNGDDFAVRSLWKDVEILGPESVDRRELEFSSWDASDSRFVSPEASTTSPPSLAESVKAWSVCSPDTDAESAGPLSPPSFDDQEPEPLIRITEPSPPIPSTLPPIQRSEPWTIPGKDTVLPLPSRLGASGLGSPAYPVSESNVPWERGRYTAEDVDDHLLHPANSISFELPSSLSLESIPVPTPLSPQEEEVFKSLCFDPTDEPAQPADVQTSLPPSPFGNIFALATRPTERLRERRSSRLLGERERIRSQSVQPPSQPQPEQRTKERDEHSEEEGQAPERVTRSRAANAKAAPRRSKRAAPAVPQRKSQRLRGKNAL